METELRNQEKMETERRLLSQYKEVRNITQVCLYSSKIYQLEVGYV